MNIFLLRDKLVQVSAITTLLIIGFAGLWLILRSANPARVGVREIGCTSKGSASVTMESLVSRAHAAFAEPLPIPGTDRKDPFYYGAIMHGCAAPTVDLRVNNSNNPPPVPAGSTVMLTWTSSSVHGGMSCVASGPLTFNGSRPPANLIGESNGPLSGPATYTYRITCSDADGSASDSVSITVGSSNGVSKTCSGTYSVGQRVRMRIAYSYSLPTAGTTRIEDNINPNLDFERMIAGPAPSGAGPGGGDALVWTFFGTSGNGTLEFDVIVLPSASGFIPNAAILRNAQGNFASSCSITVSSPPAITGDIYASLALQNLAISGPAVVSSGTGTPLYTRVGDGPIYPVSRYVPALTPTWRRIMDDNIARLRLERAQFSATLPDDFDGTSNRLGGGIWYRSSGMTIPDTSIDGRGTYIVDNGDIMITGNILSQRPVGIVARNGNIRITSSVTQLRNIYFYAPNGTIIFDDANTVLNAIGAFIAQRFQLSQRDLNITYNTQVALTPPPGFVSFILPTVLEGAP